MIIKSLEKMEKIVSRNNNLSWNGWDVVDRKRSDRGSTSPNGVLYNNKWYVQRTYKVNRQGWNIPDKYGV